MTDVIPAVAFRGRRVNLWPKQEEPLGRRADTDIYLRRELDFREGGYMCPFELSSPMLMHPDAVLSDPWNGPFRPPGIEELEELWKKSDGSQLLLANVASHLFSFDTGAGQKEMSFLDRGMGARRIGRVELFKSPDLWPPCAPNVMTEDGQAWFTAITTYVRSSQEQEGFLTVLFPYMGKNGHETRTMLVYTLENVSEEHRAEAVRRLVLIFKHDAAMEVLRLKRAA
mgnify:FL=1